MILTLTLNPAVDMTITIDAVHLGETHRVDTARFRAGGKGLNVARVAHAQGETVLALAPSGGGSGAELNTELAASGIPHLLVPVSAPTRRSYAIVDRSSGVPTVFNEHGSNHSPAEWDALEAAVAAELPRASVLVISGSLPPGTPSAFIPRLIALAHAAGVPSIADTSGPALLAAADAGATVLKPNRDELLAATGESDPLAAARGLLARGACLVLLSLGEEGMVAVGGLNSADSGTLLQARLGETLRGNATGAGDAAVAAVACSIERGITDVTSILRLATAWSAAAVLMPLAGDIHASWPELAARITIEVLDAAAAAADLPDTQETL